MTARDWARRLGEVARGVRDGDEAEVVRAVEALSHRHRLLAPLALLVGGVAMLFDGVRLLLFNWRLTVIQIPPAMWIWAAMYDLRGHLLHDRTVHAVTGPVVIPAIVLVTAITVACFWLNAVFGFAISQDGPPKVRPAMAEARAHLGTILGSGGVVGLALGLTVTVVTRAHRPWFALTLSVVIGVMMIAYVAVPARLIGVDQAGTSRRDRLSASVVGSVLGAVVSTPAYVLGRIGLLMIGSPFLRVPGILIFIVGFTLQAGATSAVKAVKMGAKLGRRDAAASAASTPPPTREPPLPPR
ncbi:MAG TPA: hypothetical protein VHZ54_03050 [Solirubrobacterales bacterium]|nr:hypothetical protein [Solirubrobacterales bacterium]